MIFETSISFKKKYQQFKIIFERLYKKTLICIFIGSVIGFYFSSKLPTIFEVRVLYKVAQIAAGGTILNGTATNVEDPSTLVFRYQNKSSFSPHLIQACAGGDTENSRNKMADIIRISSPKIGSGIIEIRVFGSDSREKTEACAAILIDEISQYHQNLIAPARKVLEENIEEMIQNKRELLRNGSTKYDRDDLLFIQKRIEELKFQEKYSQLHTGEVLNSINAFEKNSFMSIIKIYLLCIMLSIFAYFTIERFLRK